MKRRVTIQDIADALGISRNTVSKAINNSEGLAETTRERILQKAVEMGYKQFSYVQTLINPEQTPPPESPVRDSKGEVAVLTSLQFSNSHFALTMIDRLQRELAQFGYSLRYYFVGPDELAQKQLPYPLPKSSTKAFVCFEMFDWPYCDMLCALDYPLLFVDAPSMRTGRRLPADQLYMDNCTGLTELLNLLLHKGVTKLGFVGDIDHCQSFFERYSVMVNAVLQTGASPDRILLISENHPIEVYHALSTLPELPELFVCANDYIAADVLNILKKLGKSVPEDVLICGFDDTAESRESSPPLTTVHIHTQIMAFSAVQLLISRIRDPSLEFRKVYTQADLILRGSTGIPEEAE